MALFNKRSWQHKLHEFLKRPQFTEKSMDELEDLLLEADIAPILAVKFSERLRSDALKQKLSSEEDLLLSLSRTLENALLPGNWQLTQPEGLGGKLQVILFLGVNGVGKTTTLAKLAHYFISNGFAQKNEITMGAGDTFRAAAIEQLKIHGERIGVQVVAQKQGSDSAAVIYDAVSSALARGNKLVLLDTAGRMHTKKVLLEELGKINRVLDRLLPPEQRHNLLILDATTGQNALQQAETFTETLPLRGAILTKLDSQCGGGVIFSLREKLSLPVLYTGEGEKYEQLVSFKPQSYIERLLALRL